MATILKNLVGIYILVVMNQQLMGNECRNEVCT